MAVKNKTRMQSQTNTETAEIRWQQLPAQKHPAWSAITPKLLVLLRHTGCPLCREQLLLSQAMHDEASRAGVQIFAVVQASAKTAAALAEEMALDFPLLADTEASLYRALALPRGSWWQVTFGPLLRRPLIGLKRLSKAGKPGRDVQQLGGVFLFDQAGQQQFSFVQRDSGDTADDAALRRAIAALSAKTQP